MTSLTLPYATSALKSSLPGSDLKPAMDAHTASLDAYCRYEGAPAGHIENGRWPGGAPLSAVVVQSVNAALAAVAEWRCVYVSRSPVCGMSD